ncbi:TolC family protein [Coraliomargarita sp. SDUM461004]|uniref:TolC family protein n=1 Tax=Thalassobacterium sedimentorum TaxID=3041258 RepID=A0ABU1AME1_9BACT|nr:TolC family protein [Coraliomargarita sp. SDUM461004]MDQ8195961.1 TolC family protein [Coraliomargarita sp. SDUM461004]
MPFLGLAAQTVGNEPARESASAEIIKVSETMSHDAMYWVLRGVEHNFSVQIGRMEIENSQDRVNISLGAFAARATTSARFNKSERAQNRQQFFATNSIAPIFEEEVASLQMSIEDRYAYGTRVALTTSTNRIENTTNQTAINPSTFTGPRYFPEYQTTTQLQVVQPLLKNRGTRVNMAATDLARTEVLGAEFELRSEFEKVIAQILIAYAETEFGIANLRVKEDAVKLADGLIAENRRRVEEGMMSPIDVTQAEARRAEAQEEVVGARTFLAERRNRLLELTGADYVFGAEVRIGSSAAGILEVPVAERLVLAREMLKTNPIYLAALTRAEAEGIRVAYAKNQLLPQLDLEATIGYNGLQDSFTSSYDDFGNRSTPDWSVGLVFSMPLDRSADRAQVSVAKRVQRQALLTAKQTEIQLLVLLDNSVREVESAQERIGFVKESVRLAEEALVAEEKRLVSGLTTSYNVLNQQRDLSFARTRALAAEVELFRAVTQLYVVMGSLSQELNFEVTTTSHVAMVAE